PRLAAAHQYGGEPETPGKGLTLIHRGLGLHPIDDRRVVAISAHEQVLGRERLVDQGTGVVAVQPLSLVELEPARAYSGEVLAQQRAQCAGVAAQLGCRPGIDRVPYVRGNAVIRHGCLLFRYRWSVSSGPGHCMLLRPGDQTIGYE